MAIEGKVWKFGDNINTDLMMPGEVLVRGLSDEEAAKYCMRANRPDWASQVEKGDIVVAGRNMGCGSSRPAPRMLSNLGIGAAIADSMSRLFFRNAINLGFPVVICQGVSDIFQEGDRARIDFETGEITNVSRGQTVRGEALPCDSPPMQILRAGGLTKFWKGMKT